jgi:hypothetical protein
LSVAADTVLGMKKQRMCPACQCSDIKEIVYGLPDIESFDFEKHAVGGCLVTGNDDTYRCSGCEYSW